MKIKNIIGHLKTINKHKIEVTKLCFKCGLYSQGIKHDLSKYFPCELKTGFKYYTGTHSPIDEEKKEKGYSLSWLHHKGHNKHHWEYWVDKDFNDSALNVKNIPNNYIVEMFCDRVAAAKIYQGCNYKDSSAYDYFMNGTDRYAMGDLNSKRLEILLEALSKKGEKWTIRFIKFMKIFDYNCIYMLKGALERKED